MMPALVDGSAFRQQPDEYSNRNDKRGG